MNPSPPVLRFLALCLSLCAFAPFASAQETPAPGAPAIHTNRPSPRLLPLPKGEDVFHFIVFGDRTGGPVEGLDVLKQAVADTNLLDPDLVMTVGDLLPGYKGQEDWLKDAVTYREIMKGLKMPWFPVPGNHDVYWRGPGRPEGEHEANFEKHFGPLWYWFEHKKCGFVVLYTDEGLGGGQKDFTRPEHQRMSPEQMEWLRSSLEEMKKRELRHVFVFLHHPRWVKQTYPGSNWDEVHRILASAGNVRACFAGHVHRLRYDGKPDGIEYITLGTTGGSMPGFYPQAGYMHHMNVVTVRPEGIKVAVLPVGKVMDPKQFTPELIADVDRLRRANFEVTAAPVSINGDGLGAGLVEFKIVNPVQWPIEVTVLPDEKPGEWVSTVDHVHVKIEPGNGHGGAFSLIRTMRGFDEFTVPSVEFSVEMLGANARIPLPPRRVTLPLTLKAVNPEFFTAPEKNKALQLNGKQAVRVEMGDKLLPDGPFTLEAWVRPAERETSGDVVSKAEQSEFALNLAANVPGFHAHLGGKYESAIATAPLPAGEWAHLAGVYDGKELALYVNGKRVASRAVSGKRATNALPLYLGANPNARSQPVQFLKGAIDEVRLSRVARYAADFTPAKRFERDPDTVYLFHCDRLAGPFLPSDSEAMEPSASVYGSFAGEGAPRLTETAP